MTLTHLTHLTHAGTHSYTRTRRRETPFSTVGSANVSEAGIRPPGLSETPVMQGIAYATGAWTAECDHRRTRRGCGVTRTLPTAWARSYALESVPPRKLALAADGGVFPILTLDSGTRTDFGLGGAGRSCYRPVAFTLADVECARLLPPHGSAASVSNVIRSRATVHRQAP